jgi:sugar transferase (PEP-CTERM/EpsH1 system associated)
MDLLYLSHCVPNAPDKGEKIRAYYVLDRLSQRFRVHLVCFARTDEEVTLARAMRNCASVYVEKISHRTALAKAACGFLMGSCLNTGYFSSKGMRTHVRELAQSVKLNATIAYTTVMAPYAPPGVPVVLDMSDVDSEKWLQYAQMRKPSLLFSMEAKRLRREEVRYSESARRTIVMTHQECRLLKSFAPAADATYIENGVDFTRFEPEAIKPNRELQGRKFLAFVGFLDYYPNVDAVVWFADHVLGELRRRVPDLELGIIGKNPTPVVRALGSRPGIWLEPSPEDVRPYLAASAAVITPLRLARGIQNKVLEGLAMGKTVFASTPICETLGEPLPPGVVHCRNAQEFIDRIAATPFQPAACDPLIREAARRRFSWSRSLERICDEIDAVAGLRSTSSIKE